MINAFALYKNVRPFSRWNGGNQTINCNNQEWKKENENQTREIASETHTHMKKL